MMKYILDIDPSDNKKYAQECLKILGQYDGLTEDIIALLTDTDFCKRTFKFSLDYPLLKETRLDNNFKTLKYRSYDHSRYYEDKCDWFYIFGKSYVITNHWEKKKNNKTLFFNWVKTIVDKDL